VPHTHPLSASDPGRWVIPCPLGHRRPDSVLASGLGAPRPENGRTELALEPPTLATVPGFRSAVLTVWGERQNGISAFGNSVLAARNRNGSPFKPLPWRS